MAGGYFFIQTWTIVRESAIHQSLKKKPLCHGRAIGWKNIIMLKRLLFGLILICAAGSARGEIAAVQSGDAYIRPNEELAGWSLGTATIEKTLTLNEGRFELASLMGDAGGLMRDYLSGDPCADFVYTFNGKEVRSDSGQWELEEARTQQGAQGELELILTLRGIGLRVTRHYLVYPNTGLIREWSEIESIAEMSLTLTDPAFMSLELPAQGGEWERGWFTGGVVGGTQELKLEGADAPAKALSSEGSDTHLPMLILRDKAQGGGLAVGWDYLGLWKGSFGGGPFAFTLQLRDYARTLESGEKIETPKAFVHAFAGDLDALGNKTLDWQYQYLWQYKRENYFAKSRYTVHMAMPYWGRVGTEENWSYQLMLDLYFMQLARHVGAQVLWNDAAWYDAYGNWNGPDFKLVNDYARRQGMSWLIWLSPSAVVPGTRAERELGPVQTRKDFGNYWIAGQDTPKATQWQLDLVEEKIKLWGDFQWRWDMWVAFAPDRLAADQEFRRMNREFLAKHPKSAVEACMMGGIWMGYETGEFASSGEMTDGGVGDFSAYYTSMILPPELFHDIMIYFHKDKRPYEPGIDRLRLRGSMTWADEPTNPTSGGRFIAGSTLTMSDATRGWLDPVRHDFDLYHYMVAQGVAGRWSHVFRPRVEGDNPLHYYQRMNRDGSRGAILTARPIAEPQSQPPAQLTVYPKGLQPEATYDVGFDYLEERRTASGAELMRDGIAMSGMQAGEIIFLNMPNRPGGGTDAEAPTAPAKVTQRVGTQILTQGMEIAWEAAQDNNWLSYYKVRRTAPDGSETLLSNVASGTYAFDYALPAAELAACRYAVQAVDGDGNASAWVEAETIAGEPETYTAFAGYGPSQGFRGWHYEVTQDQKAYEALPIFDAPMYNARPDGGFDGRWSDRYGIAVLGRTFMRPGPTHDLARTFVTAREGKATLSGTVKKDPTLGVRLSEGCRVKIMVNERQVWPARGWQAIPVEGPGVDYSVAVEVKPRDRIVHLLERNADGESAIIAWNPEVTYAD